MCYVIYRYLWEEKSFCGETPKINIGLPKDPFNWTSKDRFNFG